MEKKLPYQKTKIFFYIFLGITCLAIIGEIIKVSERDNEIIGCGIINSIVDGYDVGQVNLWSNAGNNRELVGKLLNGDSVKVLKENGDYFLIESILNKNSKGYCMKGFVILKEKTKNKTN